MRHSDTPGPDGYGLTSRQRRVMQAIDQSARRNGYSPSLREIGEAAGLASTSSVSYQVSKLEEKGLVVREPGRPRTVMVRPCPGQAGGQQDDRWPGRPGGDSGEALAQVPLVGRIAAGTPILAAELADDVVPLPRLLVGFGELIMLRVVGDSMTGAAIADGDYVVVRCGPDAENGEIVAAMLESETGDGCEATVKTFRKQDGHAWLIPHNPAFAPIPADRATIIGKVVAVLRRV
jgi:repressor LexA